MNVMILELHRQGLSVAAIARRVGADRKTVRKYIARAGAAASPHDLGPGSRGTAGGARGEP